MEEVFEHLRTTPRGLLSGDAEERLIIFGPNRLEEKRVLNNTFLNIYIFFKLKCQGQESILLIPSFEKKNDHVGEQISEVPRFYVESLVMGYGSCSIDGHRTRI